MYLIFLDGLQFPIAPAKIEIKIKNNNKTVDLINETEINLLKQPGLTEIGMELLLPNQKYPFAAYPDGFHDAQYYLSWLEKLKVQAKFFPLHVMHYLESRKICDDLDLKVSLEEWTIKEDAKEGTDFIVDLKLKEYREFATTKSAIPKTDPDSGKTTVQVKEPPREAKTPEKSYTVQSGDSLWKIAQKILGNGTRWSEIYNLNAAAIEEAAKKHGRQSSSTGHWIYPSTVLKMPE